MSFKTVKRYISNFYKCIMLLIVMLPFQNCIDVGEFSASDSSSEGSTNGSGGGTTGGGETNSELIPVFMAAGHMRSSMYSCDGGETWRGYISASNTQRCWDRDADDFDCDHDSTSVKGITYGPAGFMITSGWGQPGKVELTTDGQNFSTVHEGSTWAGLAYGNGVYILNSRRPLVTMDNGVAWENGGLANFTPYNARKIDFVNQGEGFFISQAQSGDVKDLLFSRDNGETWMRPDSFPVECANGKVAYDDDIILIDSAGLCISEDQGYTWQIVANAPAAGGLIYAQDEFKMYERTGYIHRSTDGINWRRESLTVLGVENTRLRLGGVIYHEANDRYISIAQSWQNWYESTRYYYSDDGIDWILVDKDSGAAPAAPHPVRNITTGYMSASSCN